MALKETSKPKSSIGFRLVVALGSVALTLGVLEAGSYLFGTFAGPEQPVQSGEHDYLSVYGQHDQELFWSLRPRSASPGERWINGAGLRGPEVGPKGDGEYRILNLGESTTFAAQVSYEECYSARLEALLDQGTREQRVRVLNGGVPGYTVWQGVQFLLLRGLRLEPDMVTLYFGGNDFLPVSYLDQRAGAKGSGEGGLTDRELFERRSRPLTRLASFLTRHSNLFRGLRRAGSSPDAEVVTVAGRVRVPRQDRWQMLEQAREFCASHGIELVVIVPLYLEFEEHQPLLRRFIEDRGVTGVDLPAVLPARFTEPRTAYFVDSVHPGPEGHLLIAEAILEVISPLIR